MCDVAVQFTGPASVVALFRDVLDAFAHAGEPRWVALEEILRHVLGYWEGTPRHRDPIFARDGWRCTVPGCSARRSLHDHHLCWRSHGGGNERDNRTAICAAHHLHGVHGGAIRAWGGASEAVHWELGVRRGVPPLLSYIGDRLLNCAPG
ncbi:MAG: HNH endonuclease [Deltaproteobacteria bacterium]|nr:HNH endonuclease [Deltaproteobacteria bacterium]